MNPRDVYIPDIPENQVDVNAVDPTALGEVASLLGIVGLEMKKVEVSSNPNERRFLSKSRINPQQIIGEIVEGHQPQRAQRPPPVPQQWQPPPPQYADEAVAPVEYRNGAYTPEPIIEPPQVIEPSPQQEMSFMKDLGKPAKEYRTLNDLAQLIEKKFSSINEELSMIRIQLGNIARNTEKKKVKY